MGNRILKSVGLFFLLLILCFPLTYLFGWVYSFLITKPVGGGFLSFDPFLFGGFCMSLVLLLSFYLAFTFRFVLSLFLTIILNVIFILFFWGVWFEFFIIIVISSIIGYLLAELLKYLIKKFKNK